MQLLVDNAKDGASGGTIASVINLLESSPFSLLQALANPHYLTPRDSVTGRPMAPTDTAVLSKCADMNGFGYDGVFGRYTAPYIMQVI